MCESYARKNLSYLFIFFSGGFSNFFIEDNNWIGFCYLKIDQKKKKKEEELLEKNRLEWNVSKHIRVNGCARIITNSLSYTIHK